MRGRRAEGWEGSPTPGVLSYPSLWRSGPDFGIGRSALGNGQLREHQWLAAPVPAQGDRPERARSGCAGLHCGHDEQPSAPDAGMAVIHTRRSSSSSSSSRPSHSARTLPFTESQSNRVNNWCCASDLRSPQLLSELARSLPASQWHPQVPPIRGSCRLQCACRVSFPHLPPKKLSVLRE